MLEKEKIIEDLKSIGVYKIAEKYKVCVGTIYNFIKKHKIQLPEINLIGYTWEYLTVIKKLNVRGVRGRQAQYWLCECKCGQYKELDTKSINRNEYKSCGCYIKSKEYRKKNKQWNGYEDIHGKWWNGFKKGALKRNHKFDITIEQVWKLYLEQNKKCALSGRDIKFANSSKGFQTGETTASIDRKDNNKDYTIDNIHWVHKDVNFMKQDYSMKYFIDFCKDIAINNEHLYTTTP